MKSNLVILCEVLENEMKYIFEDTYFKLKNVLYT